METAAFSLLELFNLGGPFMWPLLLFSIATVSISIERIIYIFFRSLKVDDINTQVLSYVKSQDYKGALEYLSPLVKRRMGARIFLTLIERSKPGKDFSEHRAEKIAEAEAADCINSLENGFNLLTALGSLSPLTGFLGTVSGMIGAFRSIAEAAEVNAQIVAGGIYEALITTVFGLMIAITALAFHSILSHLADKFAAKIESACSQLIIEMAEQRANEN